ncbi:anthranilate synthase family protein [Actinosynnema pretiosum]|uniref:anthranilate synthase n=1 Tax=Actinosynnema pretiosum TaxID=42197 RepID=A0A290Z6B9_9PSEU|nr:chorismate-binding protein [Actinosynnema pretiosum]ATE54601.1 phenazine-specific anthranilate synthase component I [Actinosynnema pretiosum]
MTGAISWDSLAFAPALADVLEGAARDFALLHRPEATGDRVEVLLGDATAVPRLADLPAPRPGPPGAPRHDVFALVPYRQLAERGFRCRDDGAPLLAMAVHAQASCPLAEVLPLLPDEPPALTGGDFDVPDDEYARVVADVLREEIGRGEGANFVIKRSFVAEAPGFTAASALALFRALATGERGAYWTFVARLGDRVLVGATPERHVSLVGGAAVMNPISGTLRYPDGPPDPRRLLEFLADPKETSELYMVLDEELKMMARVTASGGRAVGPFLKEMAALAHTEYLIEGRSPLDPREILRETLLAPTVTGSPLESACRVIHRHEPEGRGYYSGVAALIGRDINGDHALDSAILLRTAEITGGRLRLSVGATLVRDSDPDSEVAETRGKAQGVLRALGVEPGAGAGTGAAPGGLAEQPGVRAALEDRNRGLARFWLHRDHPDALLAPELAGRRALVVDAEDAFTAMLRHQLVALGLAVDLRRHDEVAHARGHDLVVLGPGPGDPRDLGDPRVATVHRLVRGLLDDRAPFLAICLSHQVLAAQLGLDVARRDRPHQGVQREVDLFGRRALLGFYNSYTATCPADRFAHPREGLVEVCRDAGTGQVHALRGGRFASFQFHPESVLSRDGFDVLRGTAAALLLPEAAARGVGR